LFIVAIAFSNFYPSILDRVSFAKYAVAFFKIFLSCLSNLFSARSCFNSASKDLGINDKTIYNWIKVYKKENNITAPIDETKNQFKSS
jgi:hypothetical protein